MGNSLPDDIATVIRDLHRSLSSSLLSCVVLNSNRKIKNDDVIQLIGLMSGWYRLLCLGKWLRSTTISGVLLSIKFTVLVFLMTFFIADPSIPIHFIGEKMVSRLMSTCESDAGLRNEDMDNLKVLAFAVILQELGHQPEVKCPSHMDLIVAVYISFYDAIDSSSK
jgi:hypothetical protein